MALTAIASCGDAACTRIVSPNTKINGIELIVKQVEVHIKNEKVCDEFLLFVEELLEEETIESRLIFRPYVTKIFQVRSKSLTE